MGLLARSRKQEHCVAGLSWYIIFTPGSRRKIPEENFKMDQLSLDDWKHFLKARVVQEQGKDADALAVFDELLARHPNNSHLNASRAFALQRLGRTHEAAANLL